MTTYKIINITKGITVKENVTAEQCKEWIFNKLSKNNFKESVLWNYVIGNSDNAGLIPVRKDMVIN